MSVNKQLLSILACPICKKSIKEQKSFLVCSACKKAYPVLEGVPNMIPEDAWTLEKAKKARFLHRMKL